MFKQKKFPINLQNPVEFIRQFYNEFQQFSSAKNIESKKFQETTEAFRGEIQKLNKQINELSKIVEKQGRQIAEIGRTTQRKHVPPMSPRTRKSI